MIVVGWGKEVVMVVALTHIRAALTTWMAPGLVRVSWDMMMMTTAESCSSTEAGCRVQLMGRLRSNCEELCEALEDIGILSCGDGFLQL